MDYWCKAGYGNMYIIKELNSSTYITQKSELKYCEEIYSICVSPGQNTYTVDKSGTIMILARGSYVFGQSGTLNMSHDGHEFINWNIKGLIDGNINDDYHTVKYTEKISAGTHTLTGSVINNGNNGDKGYITGVTSLFIMFYPD